MRLAHALASAVAYSLARPAARPAPIAPETPVIIEPWRPAAISAEPDPIAEFVADSLKTSPGTCTPAIAVLAAYEAWAERRGRRAADRGAALDRLRRYGTVMNVPEVGDAMIGVELQPFAARTVGDYSTTGAASDEAPNFTAAMKRLRGPYGRPEPTLRAIPGLRARVLADAALLSAELLAVIQSARDLLEAGTDQPGFAGDVIRMAAATLDDAIADAAAPKP